jgi:nucleotide-binding universal stress UspA family protein
MKPKRILVAIDLSPASVAALWRAETLVPPDGTLHLLHVVESTIETTAPRHSTPESTERLRLQREQTANERLEALTKEIHEGAVDLHVEREVRFGRPCDEILAACERFGADLVAVGAHGKNLLDRLVLGSMAEEVVRRSPVPTLVVREQPERRRPVGRVLIVTDLSDTSREAALIADQLARRFGVRLEAVHVIDARDLPLQVTGPLDPELLDHETRELLGAAPLVAAHWLAVAGLAKADTRILIGDPATEIVDYACGTDLIVCGTHGRGALGRFAFGSVALALLRRAPCPVIVARSKPESGS